MDDGATGLELATSGVRGQYGRNLTQQSRIAILRLKDSWHRLPHYPDIVSAWEIYDAVLNHDVRTLDALDAYLAARGFPAHDFSTRAGGARESG